MTLNIVKLYPYPHPRVSYSVPILSFQCSTSQNSSYKFFQDKSDRSSNRLKKEKVLLKKIKKGSYIRKE